jgi:hypothetical protein
LEINLFASNPRYSFVIAVHYRVRIILRGVQNWTAEQDHKNMLEQLGIKKLRPGPSGRGGTPNSANYDPAKANPYPDLPDPANDREASSANLHSPKA